MTPLSAFIEDYGDTILRVVQALPLGIFLLVFAVFPAHLVAFADTTVFTQRSVFFVRDPLLEGRTIAGSSVIFGAPKTVGSLLASGLFDLNASLASGAIIYAVSTAYSSTNGQTDSNPFTTASGHMVGQGVLATNFLPLGAQVRIDQRVYTVLDRMHPRYNDKYIVDIWVPSREAAVVYGARMVYVEIVSLPQ